VGFLWFLSRPGGHRPPGSISFIENKIKRKFYRILYKTNTKLTRNITTTPLTILITPLVTTTKQLTRLTNNYTITRSYHGITVGVAMTPSPIDGYIVGSG
jgi:hypothetical protein